MVPGVVLRLNGDLLADSKVFQGNFHRTIGQTGVALSVHGDLRHAGEIISGLYLQYVPADAALQGGRGGVEALHVPGIFVNLPVMASNTDIDSAVGGNGDGPIVTVLPPLHAGGDVPPTAAPVNADLHRFKTAAGPVGDADLGGGAGAGPIRGQHDLNGNTGQLHLGGMGCAHHGKCRPQAQKHTQQQSRYALQGFSFCHRLKSPFQNWLRTAHLPPGSYQVRTAGPPAPRRCRAPPG